MWWMQYLPETEGPQAAVSSIHAGEDDELRVFPIVGREVCERVAALLARGMVDEAGELVSPRAWVASVPLYG